MFAQSLATNILFEQANVVYKGKVEKISYNHSDAEGDDFGIRTQVEKVFKGSFSGERIGLQIKKLYTIDLKTNELFIDHQFQIKEDSTYVFFVGKLNEFKDQGKYVYFTNLADGMIEGIPFSKDLELQLNNFEQYSYLRTNNYGQIPLKILSQASPLSVEAKVTKIKKRNDFYTITASTEKKETIQIKTKELNCICESGKIKTNEPYLFFLSPFDRNKYLLTDQWLGVFQSNPLTKLLIEQYKNK